MQQTIKATLVVIGDHAKVEDAVKKGKTTKAYIVALPDHLSGDPFRRERKAIVLMQGIGVSLTKIAEGLKASSRRVEITIEKTGERSAAYDEGTVHAIGDFEDLTGIGGRHAVQRWFARNDSDDYGGGTVGQIMQLAAQCGTTALKMAAEDRPAGPHKAAMETIESSVLPEFNHLLARVDEDALKVGKGDWGEVHYRLTMEMMTVARKVTSR